jgi:hypothetical protein
MLIDFGPGSRELFTAAVNQKVTYGLATIRSERAIGHDMQVLLGSNDHLL